MAKKTTRAATRKMKDKWKSKEWYQLYAPNMFNSAQIGETLSDEPGKVMDRVTEVTMHDLTGDFSKMHIKLRFKVGDVSGYRAHTYFIGHTFTSDYIRRLTRRKFSKTDAIVDVTTKDDYTLRVKSMAVTDKRIQGGQRQAIRSSINRIVLEESQKRTLGEFVKGMISGELAKSISKSCKTLYPVKRIEIRKSEIVSMPSGGKDQLIPYEPPEGEKEEVAEAPTEVEETPEAPMEEVKEATEEEEGPEEEEPEETSEE